VLLEYLELSPSPVLFRLQCPPPGCQVWAPTVSEATPAGRWPSALSYSPSPRFSLGPTAPELQQVLNLHRLPASTQALAAFTLSLGYSLDT
jgi:hypothetical protein